MIRRMAVAFLLLCGLSLMAGCTAMAADRQAQPSQPRVIALSVYPAPMVVSKTRPAKIRVVLRNVSKSKVAVDARLQLGGQVQIYALDESRSSIHPSPIQLSYPLGSIPPPTKKDFVTLAPGKSVSKMLEVRWSMLPEFARRIGWSCHFKLTANITDSGSTLGLKAWTGSLWNYFALCPTSKADKHHARA